MSRIKPFQVFLIVLVSQYCGPGWGEEAPLTVAVLDFECRDKNYADTADLVRQLVEVRLTANGGFVTVSRDDLDKILEEQKRGLSGISETAVPAVGKLLGAGAMIAGSVFKVQEQAYVTAKIFSTETGRTFSVKAKGDFDTIDSVAEDLATQIEEIVHKNASEFHSPVLVDEDEIATLKGVLEGKKLPVIFVTFNEQTIGVPAIDPAIQTEFEYLLRQCGFEIIKDKEGHLSKWIREYRLGDGNAAPPELSSVDLIIHGEGISEFASRNADLVSFRARVEMEILDPTTGKVVLADRETVTSVDLSSHIAAKSALQKAAAILAYRTLGETVDQWNTTQP